MTVSFSPRPRWLRSPLRLPTRVLLAGTALLLSACHHSSRGGAAVKPATVNLTATAVQVTSTSPRVGFPLELVTTIQTNETTPDVTVSFWAQNVDDVAAQKEQVRQFYLGSTTFPQVTPGVTDYRSTIEVPTSLNPAGTYVLLAAVDPQSLIAETKEDDNTTEVAATLQPLADPNLVLRAGTLDQQSLLLDSDQSDVGEQNADLGANLTIGVEGTLSPTPVETFVKLRIRRLDRLPGADVHDMPLYLWDSVLQHYVDVYGLQGAVQWLTLGDVVPLAATESETTLDIAEHGANSSHLDVYLPGRLAGTMIMILEHLAAGPPIPPPDLTQEAIVALENFFVDARLSLLRFSIVVDVRSKDPAFVDTNPNDNSIEMPLYVVLPGQESFAPDRPLAFEKGAANRWGSDKFGVGYAFDALASLDGRGAVASVGGVLDAEVFGNRFDFLTVDGRAQVVPARALPRSPPRRSRQRSGAADRVRARDAAATAPRDRRDAGAARHGARRRGASSVRRSGRAHAATAGPSRTSRAGRRQVPSARRRWVRGRRPQACRWSAPSSHPARRARDAPQAPGISRAARVRPRVLTREPVVLASGRRAA